MAEKQPGHLNGAYYGPSVPPPKQGYHRPSRSGGSGCGCCCWLFSFLFKLIFTIALLIGLAALIFWLIFRPHRVKFHATEASLTQFNLTNNNTLHYNLDVNISIRNPNKKIGIYYDRIEARGYYEDERFGSVDLKPFYQGKKNTSVVNIKISGQQLVMLDSNEILEYNSQKGSGVYEIDVKLYLRIRFKIGRFKTWRMKPKIKCGLNVPINGKSTSLASGFETTKCDIDF